MNKPYNQRELDMKFEQIHLTMEEKHLENKETLREILAETKNTNGRVTALENWRWYMLGGLTILGIIIVPVVLTIINKSF